MTAVLAVLYVSAIILAAAFLFTAVDWLEPNRRLASYSNARSLLQAERQSQSSCCRKRFAEGERLWALQNSKLPAECNLEAPRARLSACPPAPVASL
jgi:hypothetical protein